MNTHLESVHPLFRTAQAIELVAGAAAGTGDIIVAGDFNSDPSFPPPEAYPIMAAAAFNNAWALTHPGDSGFTWGEAPDLLNPTSMLSEQDDHVWFRGAGLSAVSVHLVGADPGDRVPSIVNPANLLWPSDHAGVVATLRSK